MLKSGYCIHVYTFIIYIQYSILYNTVLHLQYMDCIKRVIYFTLYLLYVLKVNTGYPIFIHCISTTTEFTQTFAANNLAYLTHFFFVPIPVMLASLMSLRVARVN